MSKVLLLLAVFPLIVGCVSTSNEGLSYAERRAKMCADRPAFCRASCSNVAQNSNGSYQLICQ